MSHTIKFDPSLLRITPTTESKPAPQNNTTSAEQPETLTDIYKGYFKNSSDMPGEAHTLAPNKVQGFQGYADENTIYVPTVEATKTTTFVLSKL